MAVKNAIYQVDNGNGFDEIHFRTKASQVIFSDGKTAEDKVNFIMANKSEINQTLKQINGWEKDNNTGLVEQWGYIYGLSSGETTITLPIAMKDNNYNVSLTEYSSIELGIGGIKLTQVSNTNFKVKPGSTPVGLYWRVKGWV